MIVINGRFEWQPGRLSAVRDALIAMQEASRAEDGCDDYTFSMELANANAIRITERWHDMDALTAHFRSEHMASFRAALGEHPPTNAQIQFYDAKEVPPPRA